MASLFAWQNIHKKTSVPTGTCGCNHPITQEVCKIPLHPSGYTINNYHTTHYGMKDRKVIFQPPFFAESDKNFCAKWFSVLSRTIFRSAPIDFSFSTECFSILSSRKWNFAERCLKHPSDYNANIMKGLTYILKDEWCFAHFTGEAEKKGVRNRFVPPFQSNLWTYFYWYIITVV